jgi:hypothetical protein
MICFDFESLKYTLTSCKRCFSAVRKDATKREISFHASHFTFDIIPALLINKKIWISDGSRERNLYTDPYRLQRGLISSRLLFCC